MQQLGSKGGPQAAKKKDVLRVDTCHAKKKKPCVEGIHTRIYDNGNGDDFFGDGVTWDSRGVLQETDDAFVGLLDEAR